MTRAVPCIEIGPAGVRHPVMADFSAFGMQLSWPWSCTLHIVRAAAAVGRQGVATEQMKPGTDVLHPACIGMVIEVCKVAVWLATQAA